MKGRHTALAGTGSISGEMNYFYSLVPVPRKHLLATELEVNHQSALILISVRRERRKRRRIGYRNRRGDRQSIPGIVPGHKVTADLSSDLSILPPLT